MYIVHKYFILPFKISGDINCSNTLSRSFSEKRCIWKSPKNVKYRYKETKFHSNSCTTSCYYCNLMKPYPNTVLDHLMSESSCPDIKQVLSGHKSFVLLIIPINNLYSKYLITQAFKFKDFIDVKQLSLRQKNL